ncbi:C40 family peptidase [Nocardia sp. NPDC004722]
MATVSTHDLHGVLESLLGLYGAGQPDPVRSATLTGATRVEGFSGALGAGYDGARGMQLSIADTHASKDGVVYQAVDTSGGTTADGRSRLTNQIADFQSRIKAISTIDDTRFSGPALLDAAQNAITTATKQVDSDNAAARRLATRIIPPTVPPHPARRTMRPRLRGRKRHRARVSLDASAGSNAVRAAADWLGTPYIWGGGGAGGPTGGGFDCSGLVQYAVAQASGGEVVLPRTTYEQIYSGIRVPLNEVRPGDLVFPASSFGHHGPEHVQLAAGNGMVIEAPHSGATVMWSRMPPNAVVIRVL